MSNKTPTIDDFLSFFEEVELPILLSEDTIHHIKDVTKPLPQVLIDEYITRWEPTLDEFTEIIPCFSLPRQQQYRGIIYWKASLLRYEYIIVNLDQSDTMIDEDLIIHIQAGAAYDSTNYDPDSSQSFSMEILDSGDILFQIDELNQ